MELINRPLHLTEAENRAALKEAERNRLRDGHPEGNRHDRRLAAKRNRQRERALARESE